MRFNHTGTVFGECVAQRFIEYKFFPSGQKAPIWELLCSCGELVNRDIRNYINGRQKDCGHTRFKSNLASPIFSPEDVDLEEIRWHLRPDGYATAGGGNNKTVAHRLVLERKLGRALVRGENADHKNRNKNDNRRENLRVATKAQNAINTGLRADNTSGYTGVYLYWPKQYRERGWAKRWCARVHFDGRMITLGYHKTPQLAASAYNEGAKKYYGEFAVLNVIK